MASTPKKTKTKRPKRVSVKEGDLVIITWMDACSDIGWEDHRQSNIRPAHCCSIGWVGRSNDPKNYIMVYADKGHENTEDHDSNRRITIPTGWITSIRKLRA